MSVLSWGFSLDMSCSPLSVSMSEWVSIDTMQTQRCILCASFTKYSGLTEQSVSLVDHSHVEIVFTDRCCFFFLVLCVGVAHVWATGLQGAATFKD